MGFLLIERGDQNLIHILEEKSSLEVFFLMNRIRIYFYICKKEAFKSLKSITRTSFNNFLKDNFDQNEIDTLEEIKRVKSKHLSSVLTVYLF